MSYDSQTSTILINKLRKDVDSLTLKIAVLQDIKANNVAGGTAVTAVWTARTLNTVSSDPNGLIIDLASNEWTVAAGAYQVKVLAPFHFTRGTRLRLYDVTNSVVIGYGPSLYINNGVDMEVSLNVRITPHKDNVYRLEYYCERGGHTDGLGVASNVGQPEIYTTLELTRLDTGLTKPLGAGGLQGPQGPAGPTGPAGPPGPTGGGVTSVNVSGGLTGLTTSGGPITSSGTITLGGVVAVSAGGTGATTEAAALTSLGAYPASNPSGYTSNTGTVTSFGFTNANGVSGSNLSGTNTGDQTITLTGDVTGSGTGSFPATIANGAVTFAKVQQIATDKILGRDSSGTGVVEELNVGGGVEFTGSGGIQTSAFTGDVTKAAGGTSQTIANSAVTYAKIQDISAASRLLGRGAGAGAGVTQEIAIGTGLSMSGTTLSASAAGTVTSVDASGGTTGMSFSGGPVTTTGTLTLAGTLAVANGGTGATTAAGALTNLGAYPNSNPAGYTANAGTVTNVSASGGANISVATGSTTPVISQVAATTTQNGYMTSAQATKLDGIAAGASVTSVGVDGGTTGLTTTGGPITSSGTITLAGTLALANGGTGQTSAQAAINSLAGAVTNGTYLRGNGSNNVMSAIQAVDLPPIALGSMVSGTLSVTNGGTGQTNSFTNGDLLIGNTTGGTLTKAKLTAGTGITITNGAGSITIANSGSGSGDVTGPNSATIHELSKFSSTSGKAITGASWYSNGGDLYGDAGFKTMTYGYVWIPSGTGGEPSTPSQYGTLSGRAPMYFDRTNSRLYIFNEDIPDWKYVDLS
jgi:hypothetical protein